MASVRASGLGPHNRTFWDVCNWSKFLTWGRYSLWHPANSIKARRHRHLPVYWGACAYVWQIGPCVSCKGIVPLNAPNCLMCEAPLQPQNVPQASLRLADKLLCIVCGTANPPNITSCVMCAANLLANSKVTFSFIPVLNEIEHNCRKAICTSVNIAVKIRLLSLLGCIACTPCRDAAYCCTYRMWCGVCLSVCVSVCSAHGWAVTKRLKRLICRLGDWLMWVQGTMY